MPEPKPPGLNNQCLVRRVCDEHFPEEDWKGLAVGQTGNHPQEVRLVVC